MNTGFSGSQKKTTTLYRLGGGKRPWKTKQMGCAGYRGRETASN